MKSKHKSTAVREDEIETGQREEQLNTMWRYTGKVHHISLPVDHQVNL